MMMSPVAVEEPTVERRACHPSWRDIAAVAEQLRDRRVAGKAVLLVDLMSSPRKRGTMAARQGSSIHTTRAEHPAWLQPDQGVPGPKCVRWAGHGLDGKAAPVDVGKRVPTPLIYWGDLSVTGNGDLPLATPAQGREHRF
jgi:hypothetical protein